MDDRLTLTQEIEQLVADKGMRVKMMSGGDVTAIHISVLERVLSALRQDSSGGDGSGSPLGGLGDVIAEYDRITDHIDSLDAEADFVMRGSDWREIRKALAPCVPGFDVRMAICKIISQMLNEPGEHGIYRTTRCYDELEVLVSRATPQESRREMRDERFEAFARAVTQMVTAGPFDLRDSPKSLASQVERLCGELLGLSRAEPGAPINAAEQIDVGRSSEIGMNPLQRPGLANSETSGKGCLHVERQLSKLEDGGSHVTPGPHEPVSAAPERARPDATKPDTTDYDRGLRDGHARGFAEGLEEGAEECKHLALYGPPEYSLAFCQAEEAIRDKIKPRTDEREGK